MNKETYQNGNRIVFFATESPTYERVEVYRSEQLISIHTNGVFSIEGAKKLRDALTAAIEEATKEAV